MAKSQPINAPLSASKSRQLSGWRANWRYYYEMTKPRVVMLLLLTALVGMCLATPGWVPADRLIAGLLGIGLLASAAAVLNHIVDHKIDSQMARTFNRPVVKGKVSIQQALKLIPAR